MSKYPPAPPAGTYLRSVWVQLPLESLSEEVQRGRTQAILVFSSLNGSGGFMLEQVLDDPQPADPTTAVDIAGVQGQLFTNDAGNQLYWRACNRTFVMSYPHDYLDDKAVIDFATSLNAACE